MRIPAMAALGFAAYALFLVATTPANFIVARARAAAPGVIELGSAEGTLWHGSAKGRIRGPGGDVVLDRVEWRLLPARLASGRIAFDVTAAGHGFEARSQLARGFTVWEARDAAIQADAAALTPLAPIIAAWRPGGTLAITSPAIEWNDRGARGDARVEWKDAALSLSEVRPFGSYRADLHGDGGPAKLTLVTVAGPLRVAAQGSLAPPSEITLSGDARGEGPSAAALEPLLDLIGPRRPDGARSLEIRLR
ncbi:MAG: type II secretion system protein N [Usitatibacter sp.]